MRLGNDKDKFGYYKVGNFKTYSKVEAIELHARTGHFPQWIFNELEFSSYDWKTEPSESLEVLYAQRAKQIRDNYDYVVLFYSGGSDSTNMLDSFLHNGIDFDEIVTLNYWKLDPDNIVFHEEQINVSWPRINQLLEQGHKFRHRQIDMSDITLQILSDKSYQTTRAYYANSMWGTNHLARSYLRETLPDYKKLIESGKKIVFVTGGEKPRLFQIEGKFCLRFIDILETVVSTRTQILNRPGEYDELFYWAPECAKLICKQSHVLMNFFKKHQIYQEEKYYSEQVIPPIDQIFYNRQSTCDGLTYRNLISTLIYPTWNSNTFSLKKYYNLIWNPRDAAVNTDAHHNHQIINLISHFKQLPECWLNDPLDMDRGLVGCLSPPYFLE